MKLSDTIRNLTLSWIGLDRPIPIQLDITNSCNLACLHCYHDDHINHGAIGFEKWVSILEEYAAMIKTLKARPLVIFCGGEPTLSAHLQPLTTRCTEIWGESFEAFVITNGTTLKRTQWILGLNPKNFSFQVSLDGPTAELHDFQRGRGNFHKTLDGISTLCSRGFKVNLLAVLSRANAGAIDEFFALAKSLQVSAMNFTRLITIGAGKTFGTSEDHGLLEPLELKSAMLVVMASSLRHEIKTQVHSPLAALLHRNFGLSGRFWEGLVVDYRGRYLASSRSRLIIGDTQTDAMEKIISDHPILRSIRDSKVEVCGKCELYHSCGGDRNAAYAASGNYLGADPGCWKSPVGLEKSN